MPRTIVVFFRDQEGRVAVLEWLDVQVARRDRRAAVKCRAAIHLLASEGRDLRRPTADYLRDGIYELRVAFGSVNYRMLYFFTGATAAVVSHGLVKEDKVPDKEIDLAAQRKKLYETDPDRYGYEAE